MPTLRTGDARLHAPRPVGAAPTATQPPSPEGPAPGSATCSVDASLMERLRRDWVYVGRSGVQAGALLRTCVTAPLDLARAALPARVLVQRWIRYRVDLTGALPPVAPDVRLTRVTDDLVDMLRHHPEEAANQLRSGLRFWDRGLRRAYMWLGEEGPLCIQWLLTEADGARLHRLGDWAGMYPPLPRRTGQVENLYAFAGARKRGVASRFEYALYHEARRLGLAQLVTHIHGRSEEHTSELQSLAYLVCRLLLEKKK